MLEPETSAPATDPVTYRDKEGQLLTLGEWTRLYGNRDYRQHKDTQLPGTLVRTMWEGIDDGVNVACMWHTGVIDEAGRANTVWEGYWPCTQDEAEAAHEIAVAKVCEQRQSAGGQKI
ncbi:hypothetical protein AB0D37_06865 [Streptomyces sp. NPDC048384]|uniref:hypothetical protein n=1 Tax=Streptomyces sp. NPDC048384 TaxID=3155487 RepID=UPI00343B4BB4